MWNFKKNKKKEIEKIVKLPEVQIQPKETTRKAIMKLVLINNKTDKQYELQSENEFGLTWRYSYQDKGNCGLLIVNQNHQEDENKWTAVGRFIDFSIIKCEWKTFNIIEK